MLGEVGVDSDRFESEERFQVSEMMKRGGQVLGLMIRAAVTPSVDCFTAQFDIGIYKMIRNR